MHHAIINYSQDPHGHWAAELDCGHDQVFVHNPPEQDNAWILTPMGRNNKIGVVLMCEKCIKGAPRDREFNQFMVSQF